MLLKCGPARHRKLKMVTAVNGLFPGLKFDIEGHLERPGCPMPFPRMDKSSAMVCTIFTKGKEDKGSCPLEDFCPYRHLRPGRGTVCKHWLRGLCKLADKCEYLHQYDMTKMPECHFFSNDNVCINKECTFLHIDPASKMKDCPWYDRGFCYHGPSCRKRHVHRVLCMDYMAGFCQDGPQCKFVHARIELPIAKDVDGEKQRTSSQSQQVRKVDGLTGSQSQKDRKNLKSLDQVTCYRCGLLGHYANKCTMGRVAPMDSQAVN